MQSFKVLTRDLVKDSFDNFLNSAGNSFANSELKINSSTFNIYI